MSRHHAGAQAAPALTDLRMAADYQAVAQALAQQGIAWHSFKDHVVFERQQVLTQAGRPYGVFTPYKNAWLKSMSQQQLEPWSIEPHAAALADRPQCPQARVPSLADIWA